MFATSFVVTVVVVLLNVFGMGEVEARGKKTLLLVGPTGAGKSTIGNCLLNRKPSLFHIQEYPFATNNGANGCTTSATMSFNHEMVVIDTVGFGDPSINSTAAFEVFQQALELVDNDVHLLLLVMQEGRFKKELIDFFKLFQEKVFDGKLAKNAVLVCTRCHKGWLEKNRLTNSDLNELLNSCNNRSFELSLDFEVPDHFSDTLRDFVSEANEQSRNESIHKLVNFLNNINETKVNLAHIQNTSFKDQYYSSILPSFRLMYEKLWDTNATCVEKTVKTIRLVVIPTITVVSAGVIIAAGIAIALDKASDSLKFLLKDNHSLGPYGARQN